MHKLSLDQKLDNLVETKEQLESKIARLNAELESINRKIEKLQKRKSDNFQSDEIDEVLKALTQTQTTDSATTTSLF